MKRTVLVLVAVFSHTFSSCREDEPKLDPVTASLVSALNEELSPLSQAPNEWTDGELKFLDAYGSKGIIGIGEATHGTSEFFKAKHRMFKYMVEHHGFRIFAIEADIGESFYINQAVMSGDKSAIVSLMKEKMRFWTWATNEVRDMLYWMCDYNKGKPDSEKVQYWGVDCQFNTFNPDLIKEQLVAAQVSFYPFADAVLSEATTQGEKRFVSYGPTDFTAHTGKLDALADSLEKYDDQIIAKISAAKFKLVQHLLEVTKQTATVIYNTGKNSWPYRDEYMADNTVWLREYFNNAKVVLWAHNYHVSNYSNGGTQGYNIKNQVGDQYAAIGFLFSKGSFRAYSQGQGIIVQHLDADPQEGSINAVMSHAESPVFTVDISRLNGHSEWNSAIVKGMKYFQVGSVWNYNPADYYSKFELSMFHRVIFFNTTTTAVPVQAQ